MKSTPNMTLGSHNYAVRAPQGICEQSEVKCQNKIQESNQRYNTCLTWLLIPVLELNFLVNKTLQNIIWRYHEKYSKTSLIRAPVIRTLFISNDFYRSFKEILGYITLQNSSVANTTCQLWLIPMNHNFSLQCQLKHE